MNEDPLVKEFVVFGSGKPIPDVLVFRSEAATNMSDEEFIDATWPTVQNTNTHAERFSEAVKRRRSHYRLQLTSPGQTRALSNVFRSTARSLSKLKMCTGDSKIASPELKSLAWSK